jgi:hypothetical protein
MTYTVTDLVCRGTFTLGGVDVSDEVTEVVLKGFTNNVQVPATLTAGNTNAAGATHYSIEIGYLSDDSSTTATLFGILWTAIGTASKELEFTARFRPGPQSPDNPEWSGTLVVSGADVGGKANELSTGKITCALTGAPSLNEAGE